MEDLELLKNKNYCGQKVRFRFLLLLAHKSSCNVDIVQYETNIGFYFLFFHFPFSFDEKIGHWPFGFGSFCSLGCYDMSGA